MSAFPVVERKHRIGTHYDDDMDVIEDFVEFVKNPQDRQLQQIILNYYQSRARSYFKKLRDYIFGPEGLRDVRSGYFSQIQLNQVRKDWPLFQTKFEEEMTYLQEKFDDDEVVEISDILNIFYLISKIFCMSSYSQLARSVLPYGGKRAGLGQLDHNKIEYVSGVLQQVLEEQGMKDEYENYAGIHLELMFPLTNETGLFAINTYLYAFINKVYLIGIPIGLAEFDGNTECPRHFMYHDIDHTVRTIRDLDENPEIISELYYAIIEDESTSKIEKHIHLFVLWLIIHESNGYFGIYTEETLTDPGLGFSPTIARDFEIDLLSFSEIVWTGQVKDEMRKIEVDTRDYVWEDVGLDNQEIFDKAVIELPHSLTKFPILRLLATIIYSRLEVQKRYSNVLPIG